ncbi:MAG: carboxypeptidase regulatory-like domain-containing protein [Gemmatimonadetes bacterium]|nr:carboxypeptidase regulatory-like domain-containing protein [Gemmatimonadota bacterium]
MSLPILRVGLLAAGLGLGVGAPSVGSHHVETVAGAVTNSYGMPIPSARVELRDGARALGSVWTDRAGAFHITTAETWTASWRLWVERLGYEPTEVPVPSGAGSVAIVVAPAPVPLPGLRIEAVADICSRREDPAARRLWQAAARLHAGGLDTLGIASYTEEWTDTLPSDAKLSAEVAESWIGQRTSAPLRRLSWNRRIEREGYAFLVRRSDRERSYDSWSYAPLEADLAPHFVDQTFGRLNRFHIEVADAAGWILRFCGTEQDRPFLEGAIELGPDTLMRRAEWEFRTHDPDESAGGWSLFDPQPEGDAAPLLLPRESLTWRTLPDGGTIRRAQSYEGWITVQGDSVPFLPARSEATRSEVIPEPPIHSPGP